MITVSLVAEFAMGARPCSLCLFQRYCHGLVIGASGLGLVFGARRYAYATSLAALVIGIGFSVYQLGGYSDFWSVKCTGTSTPSDIDAFAKMLSGAPDCVSGVWRVFGMPASAWNALLSGVATVLGIHTTRWTVESPSLP